MDAGVIDLARFYAQKRVLVTGHTGFKGAWLSHWLVRLGAHVAGFALAPDTEPSLYGLAGTERIVAGTLADLRDLSALRGAFERHRPEIVLHLAAQSLVRRSYDEPVGTIATNVLGTAHVLECCRTLGSVRAVVVVTSDKCYENLDEPRSYRETDRLGGHDPYSASKAAAEIVTSAYRASFFRAAGVGVASARAGNVIGGGDWAKDRLLPDLVRGAAAGAPTLVRNPSSTRPWQHVLDALSGYLLLAARLHEEPDRFAEAFNFGPSESEPEATALEVATRFTELLGRGRVETPSGAALAAPHEARSLRIDPTKAGERLGWRPRMDLSAALEATALWYRVHLETPGQEAALVDRQIETYGALSAPQSA